MHAREALYQLSYTPCPVYGCFMLSDGILIFVLQVAQGQPECVKAEEEDQRTLKGQEEMSSLAPEPGDRRLEMRQINENPGKQTKGGDSPT